MLNQPRNKRIFTTTLLCFFTLVLAAQIEYVDIPDIVGNANTSHNLDLDKNGIDDFTISSGNFGLGSSVRIVPLNGNAVLSFGASPLALIIDEPINAESMWSTSQAQAFFLNWFNLGFVTGFWQNITDGYLGLSFKIGEETHYAWLRMDITDNQDWTVYDYAYSTIPDAGIAAGQTMVLSNNEVASSKLRMYSNSNGISIENLQEESEYKLYTISGQLVASGIAERQDYKINTRNLAKGIYIIKLEETSTGKVKVEKLMI